MGFKLKIIAITANTSWYLYNFRKNTILSLIDEGYEVLAISPRDDYSSSLELLGVKYHSVYIDRSGKNPVRDIITILNFIFIYSKFSPNVVLNFTPKNNIYSSLACKILGINTINNIAGLGNVFNKKGLTTLLTKFLYKISQNSVARIFFQNYDDMNIFIEEGIIKKSIAYRLPGSGVDLERFKVVHAPDDGIVRFLLVARLLSEKGIRYYADAARVLKSKYGDKVEFQLLGFLEDRNKNFISIDEVTEWVSEGSIVYLGSSNSVENSIGMADCQVLPSYYREGVPKTLLEAAAMGKPIVTTDNVGCRETVVDGLNGYLCKVKSVESLTEKMELMINHTYNERLAMGLNSRKKIEEEFDESIVISSYLEAVSQAYN